MFADNYRHKFANIVVVVVVHVLLLGSGCWAQTQSSISVDSKTTKDTSSNNQLIKVEKSKEDGERLY